VRDLDFTAGLWRSVRLSDGLGRLIVLDGHGGDNRAGADQLVDADGALLTRYPEGLASALEKLAADHEPLEAANKATAHLYIVNPLKNLHSGIGWFAGLFNTHPPIQERIKALRQA